MFCKKCGRQLKDGAQFCIYCGEKVVMPKSTVQTETKEPEVRHAEMPVPEVEETYGSESADESDTSVNLLPVIIIGIVIVVAVLAVVGYFLWSSRSEESEETMDESVSQEESEPETEISSDESKAEDTEAPNTQEELSEPEEEAPAEEPEEVIEEGIHTYELIVSDVTWTQAYEDCIARGGHLVRINSEEEYQAILQQISQEDKNNIKFWLGGRRNADSHEYRWAYEDRTYGDEVLNGDDKYASYWLSGEPSYEDEAVGSQEMYMNMFYMKKEDRWVWNDVPDDLIAVVNTYAGTVGYICEYEE